MTDQALTPRRQAVVHLSVPMIAALIDVPEGVQIHHLIPRANPPGLDIVLESAELPEVSWDMELPRIHGLYGEGFTDDDGRTWRRWYVTLAGAAEERD